MSIQWFIKPEKIHILNEDYRTDDLLNRDKEIEKFSKKINAIQDYAVFWFIWPFGSWKTTFLNQFKKQFEKDWWKWFDFDARKYPDRENLWENFVLEFARSIDKKNFDKTIKTIDWTQNDDKKKLLNVVWEIPWLSAIKHFDYFLNTSPAKRTFEIQSILTDLLEKVNLDEIIITVEDIDRSWDAGIYFLETLHHFVHSLNIEKNVKVIVPIGNDYFTKNIDSYLKCLDYRQDFNPDNFVLDRFMNDLFIEEILKQNHVKWQIQSFLEWTFKEFSSQMTIRKLKHILRSANANFALLHQEQWQWIDPRLSIMFETAKNIEESTHKFSYFQLRKNNRVVWNSDSIFSALVYCLIQENSRINWRKENSIYFDDHREMSWMIRKLYSIKNLSVKIVDTDYVGNSVKDIIRYYVYNFPSDQDKNYFAISNVYL